MPERVKIEIEVDGDGAIKGIRTTGGAVVSLGKQVDTLSKKTLSFGRVVDFAIGNLAAQAISSLQGILANAVLGVIRFGREAQASLSELSAITGIAGDGLEALGEAAVRESMRTGVAATQQIEAFKLLASNIDIAVIGGVEGLKALGREVITLSQAAGVQLPQAANIVAGAINAFGLEASESARVVNLLAAGSKFGAAEVGDLGLSLKNAAGIAAGANVTIEETVGALEVMSQNFLKGSEAGTGLRNVMLILQSEADKLAGFGIKNVNIETDGLSKTLSKLSPLLEDSARLTEVFGRENSNAARILINNAEAVEQMTDRVTGTNTAQEQAAVQTDNFNGAVDRLVATIQGVAIDLFTEYQDELKGIIEFTIGAIDFLRRHSDELKTAGQVLGVLVASIAAYNAVTKTQIIVTKAAAIAQRLLNTAIKANPIGLIASAITAVILLMIQFRDRVADAAAVLVDFGITILNSFKGIGDALGIEAVGRGVDFVVEKLEGVSGRLRSFAEETRKNKAEQEGLSASLDNVATMATGEAGAFHQSTSSIEENTEALKRNAKAREDLTRPSNQVEDTSGALGLDLGREISDTIGDPLAIGTRDTLEGINILLADYNRQLQVVSTQNARDQILAMIQSLQMLKDEMLGVESQAKATGAAEVEAREKALISTISSTNAEAGALQSARNTAVSTARSIISAEIAKAIAKAVASIPFPLNLVLGAAAATAIKGLINSLIPGFQFGGLVQGRGGVDSQIIRATPGEFIVNPSATRENRALLESINAGSTGALQASISISGRLTMERDKLVAGIEEQQVVTLQTRGTA